jgi:integrase/recombinase XerC/integrase/recombinase XerD
MNPVVSFLEDHEGSFEHRALSLGVIYKSNDDPPFTFSQLPHLGVTKRFDPRVNREHLERLLERLEASSLPAREHAGAYLTHLYRRNRRPSTLRVRSTAIKLFLEFIGTEGKSQIEEITRKDIESFIEHEQDRGMSPASVHGRLGSVKAFLRFLVEEGTVREGVLSKRLAVKLPESLPRAIDPEDIKALLSVIDKTRNRAMVLMLLRTGMRIGELLALRIQDVDLREQRVLVHEINKTGVGRVVYFSADAKASLIAWMKKKDPREDVFFYGRAHESLTYSAVRAMFGRYLKKAGLLGKGYTLHSLRHTFASELLNAGMRLECLQPLLGHSNLEVTRRYARLTDKTREEEYFRAMALIEKGAVHGSNRFDH